MLVAQDQLKHQEQTMTRFTPVPSECTLEDCGSYERFQVNKVQVYHRYNKESEVIWVPAFENLEGFEKHIVQGMGAYHHWYSSHTKLWYTNSFPMQEGYRPDVENWYQNYLKSTSTTLHEPTKPNRYARNIYSHVIWQTRNFYSRN